MNEAQILELLREKLKISVSLENVANRNSFAVKVQIKLGEDVISEDCSYKYITRY